MTDFGDVGKFHKKFGLPSVTHEGPGPRDVDQTTIQYRINFIQEELDELSKAATTMDHAEMSDALVDIVYVALGTAHFLGYPWGAHWDAVQRANMEKIRANGSDDPLSKRQNGWDVVKPEGWEPPDHEEILRRYGWDL